MRLRLSGRCFFISETKEGLTNISITKEKPSSKSFNLAATHKLTRYVSGKLNWKSLWPPKKIMHSCKKIALSSRSSRVEFLVGAWLTLDLSNKVRERTKNKRKSFLLFHFFIAVSKISNKIKKQCKFTFSIFYRIGFIWNFSNVGPSITFLLKQHFAKHTDSSK